MDTQVEVLEGKRRALTRYRDSVASYRRVAARASAPTHRRRQRVAVRRHRPGRCRCRRPCRRLAADRPGGPAPRDRPGDARRAGPEPDQHRAPGPDRRAARRARTRTWRRARCASSSRWSSDARRDEVVHLRRPADGPRRPRAGADPAPRGARPRPQGRHPGRVRLDRARIGACRWTSRAACSGCSTKASPPTSSIGPERVSIRLDWGEQLEARLARGRAASPRVERAPGCGHAGRPKDDGGPAAGAWPR